MNDDFDPTELFGWVDHPERSAMAGPFGTLFSVAPDYQDDASNEKDIFLCKAWAEVLGKYPSYPAQEIGDCTSFGAAHALDLLQCIEIATGEPEEFKEISTEAIYGIGREIGGMLGGGDGCYGSAVARALTDFGAVPREEVGPYAGSRAKEWGRKGVPAAIKEKCKAHKLGNATLVTTLAELDAALNNGKPVTVASNQGFSMTRDADGVCKPQGSWAHQMFIAARRRKGEHYLVCQSWGDNAPQGPLSDDQPKFSFWAPGKTVARMLAVKDSWAFSIWGGFQRKDLPAGWSYMGMA